MTLELVCTGRGRHDRARLAAARRDPAGRWSVDGDHHGLMTTCDLLVDRHDAHIFWCPAAECRRAPEVRGDLLAEILDGARRVGLVEFDLSALDF